MAAIDDTDSDLANLLDQFEIFPATAATLEECGFASTASVALITKEIISEEPQLRSLPLGQRLLLLSAAQSLSGKTSQLSKENPTERSSNEQGNNLNLNEPEQLLQLWRSLDSGTSSRSTTSGTGPRSTIPPPTAASKSKDITAYVTLHPGQQGEDILKVVDGHILVGQKKTPREKLSIAQYMEGALRMADTLPPTDRNDYYGYIIRISQMAQMFSWQSVLLFDREFRREQDEKQWPWSTEAAYLMTLCLRAQTTAPNPQAQARTKKQAKIDPTSSKPVCIRYNMGTCVSESCKYAHVCMQCFGNHSDKIHSRPKNGTPGGQ